MTEPANTRTIRWVSHHGDPPHAALFELDLTEEQARRLEQGRRFGGSGEARVILYEQAMRKLEGEVAVIGAAGSIRSRRGHALAADVDRYAGVFEEFLAEVTGVGKTAS